MSENDVYIPILLHFTCKNGKKRSISYEKLCVKVYLDDEKTHVDPCPHNGHSVGWTVMTETIVVFEASVERRH